MKNLFRGFKTRTLVLAISAISAHMAISAASRLFDLDLPLGLCFYLQATGQLDATWIWTAIVAGFLISVLGGSRVQIGGPTGAGKSTLVNSLVRAPVSTTGRGGRTSGVGGDDLAAGGPRYFQPARRQPVGVEHVAAPVDRRPMNLPGGWRPSLPPRRDPAARRQRPPAHARPALRL